MGIAWRNGAYIRFVRIGKRTIKDGEYALVWNSRGVLRRIPGPRLVRLFYSTIRFCTRYTAQANEYLVVKYKNGETSHLPGPCEIFEDHVLHNSIAVEKAIRLDLGEAIVVYSQNSGDGLPAKDAKQDKYEDASASSSGKCGMSKQIIVGPCFFTPNIFQHVQHFSWHGETEASHPSEVRVLAGMRKFTKIPLLEQQLYYNTRDVKTSDNNALTLKLALFYTIVDVEKMLNTTLDVIGHICNALCADVVSWASDRSYNQVLKETCLLSELKSFPRLVSSAKLAGVSIGKVVYRGYKGSIGVEKMHQESVSRMLKRKSAQEAMEENERAEDFKLGKSLERAAKEQERERKKMEHKINLQRAEVEARLQRESLEHEQRVKQKKTLMELEEAHLKNLLANKVDLTKVFVANAYGGQRGGKTSTLRLLGSNDEGLLPTHPLHLHTQI